MLLLQYALLLKKDEATGVFSCQANIKPGLYSYYYVVDDQVVVSSEDEAEAHPQRGLVHKVSASQCCEAIAEQAAARRGDKSCRHRTLVLPGWNQLILQPLLSGLELRPRSVQDLLLHRVGVHRVALPAGRQGAVNITKSERASIPLLCRSGDGYRWEICSPVRIQKM